MRFTGRAWIFKDDDINTDVIFPGKWTYSPLTPEQMAEHAMEDHDPDFVKKVQKGDILVAGRNFGCGSSREQAVICLKYAGIDCIIAKSFARLFFRNSINSALPVVESSKTVDFIIVNEDKLITGDEKITIDFNDGKITVLGKDFSFPPLDEQAMEIFEAGGLVEYTKRALEER
ncbi:MAG: LeuD/DmdB family oxidoreductase small subunit [Candidatus Hodarchaeales archaeon]|jgi:3-isopropylmalate/(R)-2-methylmalate dehydratase small subunit